MKRSQNVRRVLLGGLTVGALTGCDTQRSASTTPPITSEIYYANDDPVPRPGFYYHAPFQAFFPLRYNHFDATRKQYFYGGQWSDTPHQSIINISALTPEMARMAEAMRASNINHGVIPRSGFGSSSGSRFVPS